MATIVYYNVSATYKEKKTARLFVVLTAEQHFFEWHFLLFLLIWKNQINFSIFSTEQLCKLTSWPKVNDRKNLVKWLLALNCLLALKVGRTIGWNSFLTSILVINRIQLYEILFLIFFMSLEAWIVHKFCDKSWKIIRMLNHK